MNTQASEARAFLTAEWRDLAMANYEIEPAALRPWIPRGTELDAWKGKTFVSVVGFRFLRTRLLGVPIPFHRNFEELNLRFYVRREAPEGIRRGVVFVKEIVPRAAIAWVARTFYNENYVALPMRHRCALPQPEMESSGRAAYEWRLGGNWNRLEVRVQGPARLQPEESEEAFITEHYWGYSVQRDGSTMEYRVEHPRWRVWRASQAELQCDAERLYGRDFAEALGGKPTSAFVADGSAVTVRMGRRLPD